MLTAKTDFLGTGPILYVCEIVFGLQEAPILCHNLSCILLTIYAILSLKAITLAPGWICLLLIVTKLLRLSSIAFVKQTGQILMTCHILLNITCVFLFADEQFKGSLAQVDELLCKYD